jgi:hypothetical protein
MAVHRSETRSRRGQGSTSVPHGCSPPAGVGHAYQKASGGTLQSRHRAMGSKQPFRPPGQRPRLTAAQIRDTAKRVARAAIGPRPTIHGTTSARGGTSSPGRTRTE